jgi:predicted DNA-binding WGR domain protein
MNDLRYHTILEHRKGKSQKFYEITLLDTELVVLWGKIGTKGQRKVRRYPVGHCAWEEHARLISEKLRKGYVIVGGEKPQTMRTLPTTLNISVQNINILTKLRNRILADYEEAERCLKKKEKVTGCRDPQEVCWALQDLYALVTWCTYEQPGNAS